MHRYPPLEISGSPSPIIAAAIHNGHYMGQKMSALSGLTEQERLREEDPFTGKMIAGFPTQVIGIHSRFEFDLNRAPESCIYLKPEDAWGMTVWKEIPDDDEIMESVSAYNMAYSELRSMIRLSIEKFGKVVVLDVHSYNHHRAGADQPFDNPDENPDINIGTGNIDLSIWGNLVDDMQSQMQHWHLNHKQPDVRRNIKFKGGYFTRWLRQEFGNAVCGIALEFKKTFMDEWTGEFFPDSLNEISEQLPGLQPIISKHLPNNGTA